MYCICLWNKRAIWHNLHQMTLAALFRTPLQLMPCSNAKNCHNHLRSDWSNQLASSHKWQVPRLLFMSTTKKDVTQICLYTRQLYQHQMGVNVNWGVWWIFLQKPISLTVKAIISHGTKWLRSRRSGVQHGAKLCALQSASINCGNLADKCWNIWFDLLLASVHTGCLSVWVGKDD